YLSAYTIDETEQVIVTQFGKPLGDPKTEPGLNFKIPLIQRLNYVKAVQKAVYERMIAERERIAEKYRSEGRGRTKEIQGEMEKRIHKRETRQIENRS
ncbi:MAG: hypothetical protein R6U38_14440, partial [Desulfatiglandaceae bacterium]